MTDFTRDRWGRPLIAQPEGKPLPYTRISSFGQQLENQFGLNKWKQRMVLLGAVDRPDLMKLASAARSNDRKLDGLVEQMMDAGGASRAANTGTAIHDVLAQIDEGTISQGDVPDEFLGPVQAWHDLLAGFGWSPVADMVEIAVVHDRLQAAGSLDNVCRTSDGRLVVVDKKTGKSMGQRPLAYMVQLAIYATADRYDIESGVRSPLGVDQSVAYIAHIPAAGGDSALYEVDIEEGLRLADLAAQVKQAEKTAKPVTKLAPVASPLAPVASETDGGTSTAETAVGSREDNGDANLQVRRDWLAGRLRACLDHPMAKPLLANRWPADLPKLASDHRHTADELVEVERVIAAVETEIEADFTHRDPTVVPDRQDRFEPKRQQTREKPREGKRADPKSMETLKSKITDLESGRKQIVMDIAKAAHESGVSISLTQRPSVRRFEIARLLMMLVEDWPDADVATAVLQYVTNQPDRTAGEIVGWMSADEATDAIGRLPNLANHGEVTIGPTGQMAFQVKEPENHG